MQSGSIYTFTDIPIYDGPILIADKSLVIFLVTVYGLFIIKSLTISV